MKFGGDQSRGVGKNVNRCPQPMHFLWALLIYMLLKRSLEVAKKNIPIL